MTCPETIFLPIFKRHRLYGSYTHSVLCICILRLLKVHLWDSWNWRCWTFNLKGVLQRTPIDGTPHDSKVEVVHWILMTCKKCEIRDKRSLNPNRASTQSTKMWPQSLLHRNLSPLVQLFSCILGPCSVLARTNKWEKGQVTVWF